MTHCRPLTEPPTSRWMAGNATLTIVTSSWITKNPRHTETRPRNLFSGRGRVPVTCARWETCRSATLPLPCSPRVIRVPLSRVIDAGADLTYPQRRGNAWAPR